jgi:hypothetical protein
MKEEIVENPIPSPIQDLINLFKKDLASVTFPDVSQAILEDLSEKVEEKAQELAKTLALAKNLGEELELSQNELLVKAVRGLAYAKVYAEDREELLEKLGQINLGKSGRAARKVNVEKAAETPDTSEKSGEKKPKPSKKTAEPKADESASE